MQDWQKLVITARDGEVSAFDAIVKRFQDMAVGYAYSILGDFQLAEDAAQEAFVEAYLSLKGLKEPTAFPSWFRKIVFRQCVRITRGKHLATVPLESTVELTDPQITPAESIVKSELHKEVLAAISSLPDLQRTAAALTYINGYSLAEVGQFLETPVSTIKSRLFEARKQLRERMVDLVEETFKQQAPGQEFTQKVLQNIHNLVTWHHGQNYLFNGCMQFLMECLHAGREYDYWFFSGVVGDSFTQLYRKDITKWTTALSQDMFSYDLVRKAFEACGFDFVFVDHADLKAHKAKWVRKVVESLDDGLPVITNGFEGNGEFSIICGYENEGKTLFALVGDQNVPVASSKGLGYSQGLVFGGAKKQAPPLADVYRNTVKCIPTLLTMEPKDGLFFGKQAFEAWADGLLCDALFEDKSPVEMEDIRWKIHGAPLCIAGTNGCAREFLAKALTFCPDMEIIPQLQPIYENMQTIFEEIQNMQGGFSIPFEMLRDAEVRRSISDKIRGFGKCCDDILEVFTRSS